MNSTMQVISFEYIVVSEVYNSTLRNIKTSLESMRRKSAIGSTFPPVIFYILGQKCQDQSLTGNITFCLISKILLH